jgi:hypothetical protein
VLQTGACPGQAQQVEPAAQFMKQPVQLLSSGGWQLPRQQ